MKKYIIAIVTILLVTTACNSENNQSNEGDITKVTQTKAHIEPTLLPKSEQSKYKEKKLLKKIGISSNNDKIVIEPKKTEEFFKNMAKTLEHVAKEFEGKTKDIKSSDIGINASKDKITIDLNKTKNFLDNFSKELKQMAKDIDIQ